MAEKIARIGSIVTLVPEVLVVDATMVAPATMTYRAGQFISIRFPDQKERRSYSISSPATRTDGFELLVKLIPGGLASEWFVAARPGDLIHFTGPMGFFVPDLQHTGEVVFAATGSGIAAVIPMLTDILARPQETGRVHLYWGLRHATDVYWQDRLDALAAASARFGYQICLSSTTGRINAPVLAHAGTAGTVFYLVGNGDMVRDVRDALLAAGVDRKKQIRVEVFYPASK